MADTPVTGFMLNDWFVEPALNRLSRAGKTVQLEPRAMAVLVLLGRHAGHVVSTDEIINEVWQGRPMGDNPVYKSIAKLRNALGDDPKKPRYIATISKKGYRLVADVVPASVPPAVPVATRPPTHRWGLRLILIGALGGMLLAVVLLWRPVPAPVGIELVSQFSGSHSQPSLAPDGRSVAFVSETGDGPGIWILEAGASTPVRLTKPGVAASRPRWSPDGERILFQWQNSIWSVPPSGGEAAEVIRDAYHPNWSRDGRSIVFERRYEVWLANSDGGAQRKIDGIRETDLILASRWPAFSPGGDEIVYFESDESPLGDLWAISAGGGEPRQITHSRALGGAPVWAPDGQSIIYSSQRGGSRTLWQVDLASRSAKPLLTGSGDDDFPDISPDGQRVIYSNSLETFQIRRTDPVRGTDEPVHDARVALIAPELSPDGRRLSFFSAARMGGMQVLSQDLASNETHFVTDDPGSEHAIPRWSNDGEFIYFYRTGDHVDFARAPAAGGAVETLVAGWDWSSANGVSVSPDGQRAVYSRLIGQSPVQTLIRELDSGVDEIFHATLEYPRWSSTGEFLLGSRTEDQRFPGDVVICAVATPGCRVLAEDGRVPVWGRAETTVYFVRGFGRAQDLYAVNAEGVPVERKLMRMAPLHPLGPFYSVASDGSVFWVRYEKGRGDLWQFELPGH